MSKDVIARIAERQHWLAPVEEPAQRAVHAVFEAMGDAGPAVRRALHGNWLHEPLHAVLTDVPVGAWTAAVVFDSVSAMGAESLNTAADACVGLGLVSAMGAAVTGMNDWAEMTGAPRRIGAVHAVLNIAATGFFAASCVYRRKAQGRSTARSLAALGLVLLGVSAHLGGNLVYEHGVSVQDTRSLT